MPAPEIKRLFIPFGNLQPDGKLFNNDGMTRCENVVPISGNYLPAPCWTPTTGALGVTPLGFHVHSTSGTSWRGYMGSAGTLKEFNPAAIPWTVTDKTRTVGGAYGAGGAGGEYGWQGASFGDAVIMTDYVDDVQLLTSPSAANFQKLFQSGGANPGMDPKAKFAWPMRGNMFFANLNLAAPFDGLPAGANPNVVAWSQTDNARQVGSYNATPQLTGTGYQPLNYDLGSITGGLPGTSPDGTEYSIISLQQGFVRCEGPPYTFRLTSRGVGCQFPNSMVRFDTDIYFWGSSGPMKLPGGLGPAVPIGSNRIQRSLAPAAELHAGATIFPVDAFNSPSYEIRPTSPLSSVSGMPDMLNRSIWWCFYSFFPTTVTGYYPLGNLILIYSVDDDRFSFVEVRRSGNTADTAGVLYLQTLPDHLDPWLPGRDLVGLLNNSAGTWEAAVPAVSPSVSMLLERAFNQLDPELTSRIIRVRPVLSAPDVFPTVSVLLRSKNVPGGPEYAFGPFTGPTDGHGWIPCPTTKLADFHQIQTTVTGGSNTVRELEGIEVEFEVGGAYSA